MMTYQSKQNERIVKIKAPPECTLRDKPSQDRQSGSDQENPSNHIDERTDIRAASGLARDRVMRRGASPTAFPPVPDDHRIVFVVIRSGTKKSSANRQKKILG